MYRLTDCTGRGPSNICMEGLVWPASFLQMLGFAWQRFKLSVKEFKMTALETLHMKIGMKIDFETAACLPLRPLNYRWQCRCSPDTRC